VVVAGGEEERSGVEFRNAKKWRKGFEEMKSNGEREKMERRKHKSEAQRKKRELEGDKCRSEAWEGF